MFTSRFIRLTFLLLLSVNVNATFMVEGVFPLPYSMAVTAPIEVTLSLSDNIHTPSVSSASVKICGQFSGSLPAEAFQVDVNNSQILLSVTAGFFPGEQVTVSLFDIISEDLSDTLNIYSWVFSIGAAPGIASFNLESSMTIEATSSIRNMRCLDWNGDGLVDILFTTEFEYAFFICTGTEQGSFSPVQVFPLDIIPMVVELGDFNNDHYTDVIVGGFGEGEDGLGFVFLNDQSSGIIAGPVFDAGPEPSGLLPVDLNQDFQLDILASNTADNYFRVLLNDGLDGFDPVLVSLNDFSQSQLCLTDLQNDGIQEILYFQDGGGVGGHVYAMDQINWISTPVISTSAENLFLTSGDFNGDHLVDLFLNNSLFLNSLDPASWQTSSVLSDHPCLVFDYDQDGDLDALSSGNLLKLLENDGAGNFSTAWTREGFGQYINAEILDFDNDQDLDFTLSDNNQILFFSNSQDNTPPNPPYLYMVETDSTENFINWTRGGQFDNYLYEIFRGINQNDSLSFLAEVLAPTTEYVDTNMIALWNTYYYAVRAQDAFGNNSAFSETLSVNTIPPDPVPPLINNVEPDSSLVTLFWNHVSDTYYIDHYVVYRRTIPDSVMMPVGTVPADSNRYADGSVEANQVYRYAVASVNQIGQSSALSPEVEVRTIPGGTGWIDFYSLDFYPLQVGNFWQYRYNYWDYWSGSRTSYYSKEVVGDTLVSESGIIQQIVQGGDVQNLWYVDTLTTILYKNNNPVYRLNSEPGDPGFDNMPHLSTYESQILECPVTVKSFGRMDGSEQQSKRIARGFGYVYSSCSQVDISSSTTLIYARINGVEYGTFLGIDDDNSTLPSKHSLFAYPNPFNAELNIILEGDMAIYGDLVVLNLLGQQVATLEVVPASRGLSATWKAKTQPSGIYIIYARGFSGQTITKKIALIK